MRYLSFPLSDSKKYYNLKLEPSFIWLNYYRDISIEENINLILSQFKDFAVNRVDRSSHQNNVFILIDHNNKSICISHNKIKFISQKFLEDNNCCLILISSSYFKDYFTIKIKPKLEDNFPIYGLSVTQCFHIYSTLKKE